MKFSIITVSFNSAATIQDTLKSVVNQTYNNIEYIIVDGKSTDTTVDIIKEYELQFNGKMKWISEPDNGLYDAMNKGMQMATGDIIGILNSDDLFCDQHAVEKIVNRFMCDSTLQAVYADLFYVSQTDTNRIIRYWKTGSQRPFRYGWHPAHPTFYVMKSVYEYAGYFDLQFKLAADFEIMLRFVEKHKIKIDYLSEALVKMRLGGATNKNIKNIVSQNIECINAFQANDVKVNSLLYPFYRIIPKLMQFFQ